MVNASQALYKMNCVSLKWYELVHNYNRKNSKPAFLNLFSFDYLPVICKSLNQFHNFVFQLVIKIEQILIITNFILAFINVTLILTSSIYETKSSYIHFPSLNIFLSHTPFKIIQNMPPIEKHWYKQQVKNNAQLTGSHTEIPLEPKKCSLPNTTTAVCQMPSMCLSAKKCLTYNQQSIC